MTTPTQPAAFRPFLQPEALADICKQARELVSVHQRAVATSNSQIKFAEDRIAELTKRVHKLAVEHVDHEARLSRAKKACQACIDVAQTLAI